MWLLENFRTMHVAYIVFLGQRYSRISSERTFVFSWLCISWPDSADHSSNFTFLSKKASLEQCKFDYQVLANYYSFQTSRVSCGCSLGFVQSFCEELSYFRPVLSPHSQSGMHGLLTLLPILKASWVCVLGSTFTCGHPSHPPPPPTLQVLILPCLILVLPGQPPPGSVWAWLFAWSIPLCRTWLATAVEDVRLQVAPLYVSTFLKAYVRVQHLQNRTI